MQEQTLTPSSRPSTETGNSNQDDERKLQDEMRSRINEQGWLKLAGQPITASDAKKALIRGDVRFILYMPARISPYINGEKSLPIRLQADSSDPYVAATVASLVRDLQRISDQTSNKLTLTTPIGRVDLTLESQFQIAQGSGAYLVPSLSGVILTLTLTLMAAFAFVREQERGTWLSLLSVPVSASVIVLGKLLPYFLTGVVLFAGLNLVAVFLFHGNWVSTAQMLAALFFILGQLGLGVCISLIARTQMQAMQMGVFFYLPSILLSGFMFPFHSMPQWARFVGEVLPLTHFLRVLRADLFRQADASVQVDLAWPILVFACASLSIAILAYRRRIA